MIKENKKIIRNFINQSLIEDVGDGDHSALSCIPKEATGKAKLIFKSDGIAAGISLAESILLQLDKNMKIAFNIKDGEIFEHGMVGFVAEGNIHALLKGERLLLNCIQRMSAIATLTAAYVVEVNHTKCKILDTRKTTPNFRFLEKWAVRLGGGFNHRFGLYDMIMLKDNHVDFCGGIRPALEKAKLYNSQRASKLFIEIETRNLKEVEEAINCKIADRIMLDNFVPKDIITALKIIDGAAQTEASGGINLSTIASYAEAGVDFISVGALTHGVKSLDISFKTLL